MRRPFTLILLMAALALAGWIPGSALHAEDGKLPADACLAAPAPQPQPAVGEAGSPPAIAAACTPSPLCPSSCDADCKSRGARFGFCSADKCCYCIWKI